MRQRDGSRKSHSTPDAAAAAAAATVHACTATDEISMLSPRLRHVYLFPGHSPVVELPPRLSMWGARKGGIIDSVRAVLP